MKAIRQWKANKRKAAAPFASSALSAPPATLPAGDNDDEISAEETDAADNNHTSISLKEDAVASGSSPTHNTTNNNITANNTTTNNTATLFPQAVIQAAVGYFYQVPPSINKIRSPRRSSRHPIC
ncbi:hypothetical protein PCANC_20041 [Puccinia coronata f. sp. avenae]|uniref:Uncharacterized protein n=1 Tax=Puccinia coronata f. sp. avenae TaxID=200324 RepID=A0A2N5T164_9BASI|nr:hypothetical protein PCANC_20041 [Puccinia coronata f. sp. avenae]